VKFFSRLIRMIHINFVLIRYNLDEIIFESPWFYPLRFLSYFNPWYWLLKNKLSRGERIRLALIDLGPIFIKAGQVISTRRDLIPDDIAVELEKLQDRVPPFETRIAKKMIEEALQKKIPEVFLEFMDQPLASASIAQVHAGILHDGRHVAIKILRPDIQKIIERDVDLLETLAKLVDNYSKEGRRFKPKEMVAEIKETLFNELDLMREGANASQLKRNFKHSPLLYVPEIIWEYCNKKILMMERIEGIPVHSIQELKSSGFNMKNLAERGVEIFFTQVFRDSFFHADMHPGNIFVSKDNLENPQFIAVDFGIVGSLNTKDQRYLAENMLAFIKRDYQRVAELHISSGWLPPDTRIDQFEGAIRAVSEPIFERPLKEISFGQLLLRLFQTARHFNINIQPQLILLQKTLLNIEGVGRQLYPDLDLWKTASPFLEKWLKKQVGAKAFLRRIRENLPYWSEKFPEIPGLIHDVLANQRRMQEDQFFKKRVTLISHKKRYFLWGFLSAVVIGFIIIKLFSITF